MLWWYGVLFSDCSLLSHPSPLSLHEEHLFGAKPVVPSPYMRLSQEIGFLHVEMPKAKPY